MSDTKEKKLLFSVSVKDMRRDTFRCPGNGGQKINKTECGVRLSHLPSGAVEMSCESRIQQRNEQIAFLKLVNSSKFKAWQKMEISRRLGRKSPEQIADELLARKEDIKLEIKDLEGKWKEAKESELT